MEVKQIVTEINSPVTEIHYTDGYDYITICGGCVVLLQNPIWENGGFTIRLPKESTGNQYRFVNHGLRQLSLFPDTTEDKTIQSIMILFKTGYTENDIKRIQKYASGLKSIVIYVNSVNELIEFLNRRKEKKRLIKACYIYAHGVLNYTSFHYRVLGSTLEQQGLFGIEQIKKIDESIFAHDADITTYACRNGISLPDDDFTEVNGVAGQENSPAQYKANYWKVNVRAMEMRSDYSNTYGSKDEINAVVENYNKIIIQYEKMKKEYDNLLLEYQNKLEAYHQAISKGQQMEKPQPISPPIKPKDYDLNKERYDSIIIRDRNEKDSGGPIMPRGAWYAPKTGKTPLGLKSGLLEYKPKI